MGSGQLRPRVEPRFGAWSCEWWANIRILYKLYRPALHQELIYAPRRGSPHLGPSRERCQWPALHVRWIYPGKVGR
jgi:hypothetical protein